MSSFKLKFKIELLEKIQKNINNISYNNHKSYFEEFQMIKISEHSVTNKHNNNNTFSLSSNNNHMLGSNSTKSKCPPHSKYSMRNSKIYTGDIESLPGYENLINSLSSEEKENLINYLKSIDTSSLIQTFNLINSRKYYPKLKCKNALEIIRSIYNKLVGKFKDDKDNNYELNDGDELYICFKDIMNVNDIDTSDIFSLFKYNDFYTFNITHFILLVYLFAAYECDSMQDFLINFGDDFYKEISGNEAYITVSRLKKVGSLLGIKEKKMNLCLENCNFGMYTKIDYIKFKEFYSKVTKKENNKNNNEKIIAINSGISNLNNQKKSSVYGSGYKDRENNILNPYGHNKIYFKKK